MLDHQYQFTSHAMLELNLNIIEHVRLIKRIMHRYLSLTCFCQLTYYIFVGKNLILAEKTVIVTRLHKNECLSSFAKCSTGNI